MAAAASPRSSDPATLFPRLCKLSSLSTLALFADWSRPLLFNVFVSQNLKGSGLTMDEAASGRTGAASALRPTPAAACAAAQQAAFEMDCVSLAIMSLNIVAFATASGFNGAVNAYAPVAFGAGNSVELHLVLYRQLLLLAAFTMVLLVMLVNAEALLLFIGQPAAVASRTGAVLRLMAWSVPGDIIYDCLGQWTRSQQRHSLVTTCSATALSVNVLLNFLLADPARPFWGPIAALTAQNTLLPVLLAFGLFWWDKPIAAPFGAVLAGLPQQFCSGVAQMCWACAECWAWQVQVFEARALSTGGAAGYALLSSTYSFLIMVPGGACLAVTALAGEAVGAGLHTNARKVLVQGCFYSTAVVLAYGLPLTMLRNDFAEFISGGVPAVQSKVAAVLPVIFATHLFDGIFNILKSWLTVRQHQAFGAVQSLMVYYGVGLPVGWWLTFPGHWGLVGLWTGLGLAVVLGVVVCAIRTVMDLRDLFAPSPEASGLLLASGLK
uniref:Multidrug and toxin extrusion protein n=1 Tax=Alexandrium monilatum TaxID=311494 RepID=A0A7S4SQW4_9DINO